ncbi:MAG: DUF4418 family protein [Peptococcaceae bacterium]|nr:DUF4418 family protein [Peptococcaceae bacterium]
MKQSKNKVLYGVIGLLGAVAAVLPLAIYHFVETAGMSGMHGMAMACEKACIAEAVVGAAIVVIAIASLFIKNAKLGVASSAVLFAGGIAAIATPSFIGLCESEEMACRYITAPTLAILGAAIIVLSAARLVVGVVAVRKTTDAV